MANKYQTLRRSSRSSVDALNGRGSLCSTIASSLTLIGDALLLLLLRSSVLLDPVSMAAWPLSPPTCCGCMQAPPSGEDTGEQASLFSLNSRASWNAVSKGVEYNHQQASQKWNKNKEFSYATIENRQV